MTYLRKAAIIGISVSFWLPRTCFIKQVLSRYSLNAKYTIVLKNVNDTDQFSHLARQVLPHDSKGLLQAYLYVTEAPHGYLLDLSQDRDVRLRFRTCIFPNEANPLIYVDIGNETHKRKLPHSSLMKKRSAKITESHHIELWQGPRELYYRLCLECPKRKIALTGCERANLANTS